MKDKQSSQSAELNADHGDRDPSFGAGLGGFVITPQPPLAHQPTEGALDHPPAWQDFEAHGGGGAFDDFDRQFGAEALNPVGERLPSVTAIDPQDAPPREPAQAPAQQDLCAGAFGGAGRGHGHAEPRPHGVHQQRPLAPFDPLAGVLANLAAVTSGFYTLTVQNRGRWPAALAVSFPNERAQRSVERGPLVVADPLPEDRANRFPSGKAGGQITPWAATLDGIQDGSQAAPPINGWAAALGRLGEQRFEVSPLGLRETGLLYDVFHAPTEAALKIGRPTPSRMSTHPSTILSLTIQQTREPQRQSAKSDCSD